MKTKFFVLPLIAAGFFGLMVVSESNAAVQTKVQKIQPMQPAQPETPVVPATPKTETQIINPGEGLPIESLSSQMGTEFMCQDDGYLHLKSESAPKVVVNGRSLGGKVGLSIPVRCQGDKYFIDIPRAQ